VLLSLGVWDDFVFRIVAVSLPDSRCGDTRLFTFPPRDPFTLLFPLPVHDNYAAYLWYVTDLYVKCAWMITRTFTSRCYTTHVSASSSSRNLSWRVPKYISCNTHNLPLLRGGSLCCRAVAMTSEQPRGNVISQCYYWYSLSFHW